MSCLVLDGFEPLQKKPKMTTREPFEEKSKKVQEKEARELAKTANGNLHLLLRAAKLVAKKDGLKEVSKKIADILGGLSGGLKSDSLTE